MDLGEFQTAGDVLAKMDMPNLVPDPPFTRFFDLSAPEDSGLFLLIIHYLIKCNKLSGY